MMDGILASEFWHAEIRNQTEQSILKSEHNDSGQETRFELAKPSLAAGFYIICDGMDALL